MTMYGGPNWHWCFIHLHRTLVASLVVSSSLSAGFTSISSSVGREVVLPCNWKSRLADSTPLMACSVLWQTPKRIIFEQRGTDKWEASSFQGRVAVLEERLGVGDCSLVVNDVQLSDEGLYEGFMVVDGARMTRRVFIQSVQLTVFDYTSEQLLAVGGNMVLDLHTPKSVKVLFQGRNQSEWSELWSKGKEDLQRLEKNQHKDELTLKHLTREDGGVYRVLDERKMVVSTVHLKVEEVSERDNPVEGSEQDFQFGGTPTNACCHLVLVLGLIINSLILCL